MALKKFWINNTEHTITYQKQENTLTGTIQINNEKKEIISLENVVWHQPSGVIIFSHNNRRYKAQVVSQSSTASAINIYIFQFQKTITLQLYPPTKIEKHDAVSIFNKQLLSPLTGRIVKICVVKDEIVEKKQPLVIIESMKMENEIRASHGGCVKTIPIKQDTVVESGRVLMTFEEIGEAHATRKNTHVEKEI